MPVGVAQQDMLRSLEDFRVMPERVAWWGSGKQSRRNPGKTFLTFVFSLIKRAYSFNVVVHLIISLHLSDVIN
jgi:hypothetical protein